MTFDSADYYFIDFQSDLPKEAAFTHIGMYVAWLALRGLGSAELNDYLYHLRTRRISCGEFLAEACDGKLGTQDVNAEGRAFSEDYYAAHFQADYERLFKTEFGRTGHKVDDFYRRLRIRSERLAVIHEAFIKIACGLIGWRKHETC